MQSYSLTHLSDGTLTRELASAVSQERSATAAVLAHIAEFDFRKLYAPAGYASMHAYCLGELRLSEQAAYKRIHVGRAARRFPVILEAVAAGRLHLSGLLLLISHLTPENVERLLAAASHRTCAEIELLLAQCFPKPDMPTRIELVGPAVATAAAEPPSAETTVSDGGQLSLRKVGGADSLPQPVENSSAPGRIGPEPRPKVTPLAPNRFAFQFTADQETHDLLRQAQDLLGHQVPAGDVAAVVKRALQALVPQLQKQKFGATSKPRPGRGSRPSANPRNIQNRVRRAVWKRDGGRCTFVSESGKRCDCRRSLELDHIEPLARGGSSTVANLRLRCRAHNQYEAERSFGAEFMRHKRAEARRVAEEVRKTRATAARRATEEVRRMAAARSPASLP